ncbi:molybdopterin converting factor subunit 1 [Pseudalkalibacillus salsuginis]|uniref:molybdopterin converting factor subunit 1 n=1 Tax=Pseudalkalibacillus salsuginis TaxID=2910972 RepID=UPI001CD68F5E|nr:molybdopterin converting factor subunit 1 [Pseudalkalibacillus salsuginis]MCF6409222.1 molybdopterin converting factor subunit 1 [Pseudalkalibacillus salsuginis]
MINVLLFAGLQEKVGKSEILVDKDILTIDELVSHIREIESRLDLTNVMVAVNEELVNDPDQVIRAGDTVALLPPVSGG